MYFGLEVELTKDKQEISPVPFFKEENLSPYSSSPKLYMKIGYSRDFKNSIDLEDRLVRIVKHIEMSLPEDVYYNLSNKNRNRFVIQCPNEAFAKIIAANIQIISNRYMPGIMYSGKDYYKFSDEKYPAVLGIPSNFLLSSTFPYVIEILLEAERKFNYKKEESLKQMNTYLKEEMIKLAKKDRVENRFFRKNFIPPKAYSLNVIPPAIAKTPEFQKVAERLQNMKYYRKKYLLSINATRKVSVPYSVFDGPDMFFPKKYESDNPTKRHILIAQYGLYSITPGVFFMYIPKEASISEQIDMILEFIDKVEDTLKDNKEVEMFLDLEDKSYEEYPKRYSVSA